MQRCYPAIHVLKLFSPIIWVAVQQRSDFKSCYEVMKQLLPIGVYVYPCTFCLFICK